MVMCLFIFRFCLRKSVKPIKNYIFILSYICLVMQSRLGETSRAVSALQVIIGGHVFAAGLATYFGNETWYSKYLMPTIHRLFSPETAHQLAVKAAHFGLVPRIRHHEYPELKSNLWKLDFPSPVGLAAGFDKHGEAVDGLLRLGFSFVEVGTVTPEPQPGNAKPRLFRLSEDKAVINRYGFNSEGHRTVYHRLKVRNEQRVADGIVGVNVGKNTLSSDAASDYVHGIEIFTDVADYIVINVSCPNTEGLRNLQHRQQLEKLLKEVVSARDKLKSKKPPLLLKISPDLSLQEKEAVATIVLKKESGIDGLIVCNTTTSRPSLLKSRNKSETGGLSGEPLKELSTGAIKDMYRLTNGKVPIIGVGGVSTAEDAYEKIRAGASLIQLYTSMVYEGPVIVPRINRQLAELLRNDGYSNISEAIGADLKKSQK